MQLFFQTPPDAPRWKRWLLYSPLARIVLFAIAMAALVSASVFMMKLVGYDPKAIAPGLRNIIRFGVQALCTVLAYLLVVKLVERRRVAELDWRLALPQTAYGVAYGAILISAVIGVLWMSGAYRIDGANTAADWVVPLLTGGVGAAVSEEIIFRGVLYRITEEGLGSAWALALSAIFFGGVHLVNVGSTVWSSLAIAIEAGLLLGLVYHLTRTLWVCIGLHMGWNFFQGYVWGVPVSGTNEASLIVSSRPGPEWLTGGAFGAEASVVAVLLNLGVALVLLAAVRRRNMWVPMHKSARLPVATHAAASTGASC